MVALLLATVFSAWAEPGDAALADQPLTDGPAVQLERPVYISLGLPIIAGDFQVVDALTGVEPTLPALQRCFSRGNAWEGEVLVRAVIVADGSVREAAIATTTLESPAIERCTAEAIAAGSFAAAEGRPNVTVVLPLNFYPE